jgi:16S rRNA G966 N2-methylase RsmD
MRIISGKHKGRKLYLPTEKSVRPTTDRTKEALFCIIQAEVRGAVVLDLFSGSGALGLECLSRGAERVVFADIDTQYVKRNLGLIGETAGEIFGADIRRGKNSADGEKYGISGTEIERKKKVSVRNMRGEKNSAVGGGAEHNVIKAEIEREGEIFGADIGRGKNLADGEKCEIIRAPFERTLNILAGRGDTFDLIFLDPPYNSGLGEAAIELISQKRLLKEDGKIIFEHFYDKELKDSGDYVTIYDRRIYGTQAVSFFRVKE